MSSPDRPYWTPLRIALWGLAAVFVSLLFGRSFVAAFRPPEGQFPDFSQEWLSARNYWAGTPVYADQAAALRRHTGLIPQRAEDMLPWNAHPPASVLLALPFGKLTYPDAHLTWNLLTFPLIVVSLWLVARELRLPLSPWSVLPAVALLGLFNPLYIQLLQGQLNPLLLLLLTVAWIADRRDRPGWAGVAVGVAAGLKLYPGFLFLYFLCAGRWRALAAGAAAVVAANAIPLVLFGPAEFRTYVERVVPSLSNYQSSWRNVSLTGFWLRIFNPQTHEMVTPLVVSPAATALLAASRLLVVGLVGWSAWRARSVAARDRAFAAAVVGMVLVTPVAWTHYFVLLALPAGLLWARAPAGPLRWAVWPALLPLWLPENFFARLAVGPQQAVAMVNLRHSALDPVTNLTALSAFTYALLALLALILLTPDGAGEPPAAPRPPAAPPAGGAGEEDDEERLNRRLFGPVGGG